LNNSDSEISNPEDRKVIPDGHNVEDALLHLSQNDDVLAKLIGQFGPFTPEPHTNYYYELVSSIISQQLSVKAAATIEKRFVALFGDEFPTPEQIVAVDIEQLRSVGMSRPKASYVIDLARHIIDGELQLDHLPQRSNDEIIKELIAVKGIGEWTAHMFLIFALGRLDVLPVGDLGFRAGVQRNYGFDHLPSSIECKQVAKKYSWHPYESVATWYMWKSLDNEPKLAPAAT
jgi:DNA-3-methyladenine glycosylase II